MKLNKHPTNKDHRFWIYDPEQLRLYSKDDKNLARDKRVLIGLDLMPKENGLQSAEITFFETICGYEVSEANIPWELLTDEEKKGL